jgi:hypothetical protein
MKSLIIRGIAKLFNKLGCEVHYKNKRYYWMYLPVSDKFLEVYNKYNVKNVSYVGLDQLHPMYQFLSYAITLEGDVAHLGVYKGGSAAVLASLIEKTRKTYHLFDTFEGLPTTSTEDNVNGYKEHTEKQMVVRLEDVHNYLKDYSCIKYHKGYFPDTAKPVEDEKFCFVYLDSDLYQSTKDGLEFFYPRMVKGGVIVVDDYGSRRWAGVKKAVDEFGKPVMEFAGCQATIIKQ